MTAMHNQLGNPIPVAGLSGGGEKLGFRSGEKGAHSSRTIMLDEITALLAASPPDATRDDYRALIIGDNALAKRTAATRRSTYQRLSELYALDPRVLLFRVMRQLWQPHNCGRPLLALLLALARDPLLCLTAPPLIALPPGAELGRKALTDALVSHAGARFNDASLDKIVRNAASSWTQSGHLNGRSHKIRQQVHPTPEAVTFALVLGFASGLRGSALLETLWAKILDVGADQLLALATDARRLGYLDLKIGGGIVEISFTGLFTESERRLLHGPH